MDQHRPAPVRVADIAQDGQQMVEIVAVDRAHIVKAHLLEQRAAGDEAARIFLRPERRDLERLGEAARHFLRNLP